MKITNTLLVLFTAFIFYSNVTKSQVYNIRASESDGFVSDPNIIDYYNPYLEGGLKVGKSAVDATANTTSAIIPFKLPPKPEGKLILSASLKVYVYYGREYANTNVDLYAMPYKSDSEIFAKDHYSGEFFADRGTDAGIEDDYFTKNVEIGIKDNTRYEVTSYIGNQALVKFLNEQYQSGAKEGDWIFLRLSVDNPGMTDANYFGIGSGDGSNPAILRIDYEHYDSAPAKGDMIIDVIGEIEDNGVYGNGSLSTNRLDTRLSKQIFEIGGIKEFNNDKIPELLDNYDGVAVIPFKIPYIPNNLILERVEFSVNIEEEFADWGDVNCDLYGIDARDNANVIESDFYTGQFDADGNSVSIQNYFIEKDATVGIITSLEHELLTSFVQNQYDMGNEGKYLFLRISPDVINVPTWLRVYISSCDTPNDLDKPRLKFYFLNEESLGVSKDKGISNISVYPNPVNSGIINVKSNSFKNNANVAVRIFNVEGKLVYKNNKISNGNNIQINIDDSLNQGIYYLKLISEENVSVKKIIIE